jgi:hypothetical protein
VRTEDHRRLRWLLIDTLRFLERFTTQDRADW